MHSLLVKVAFLFALGISASPAPAPAPAPAPEPVPAPAALVPRNAAPINSGAEALIEKVEGFRKNFYYIDGHKTIGTVTQPQKCTLQNRANRIQAMATTVPRKKTATTSTHRLPKNKAKPC